MSRSPIPDHELPGFMVIIIMGLVIMCVLLTLAFLGYLPSPLSSKLDAIGRHDSKIERTLEIVCATHVQWVGHSALVCFDEKINPRELFLGTR